ncbi:ATP-binding protein [Labilibaculum antarcticum]|nr:ATP-binding protein [Labilibaculum antarcticum]
MKRKQLIASLLFWLFLMGMSFSWNYHLVVSNNQMVVLNKSRSFFDQILVTRAWSSEHNGIYVPITEKTKPNPYLKDPFKNITSTDGIKLTKINPSYMTRQIAELNKNNYNLQFHITSLNPIRPENKATENEAKALNEFELGAKEKLEFHENDTVHEYMYMAPLVTQKSCLKCHSHQGYQEGDIRGGISISFPAEPYTNGVNKQILSLSIVHFIILILGYAGIILYHINTKKHFSIIKIKNEELNKIISTKDKFFSIIAHDLRSPISTILGYLDLLQTDYNSFSKEEQIDFISNINESAKSSFKLLNNLLLWARSQQNRIMLDVQKHNLKSTITEAIDAYLSSSKLKKISIELLVPEEIFIYSDSFTLQCVISNLFNNAIKFTPKNGVIFIKAKQENGFAEIQIIDNGVGIPEERINKLFKIEESVSTKGTNDEKGTGLGLLLCKEFIEKNNGSIQIVSKINKGTRVIFRIPTTPQS